MGDRSYDAGLKQAYANMLAVCLRGLDADDPQKAATAWVLERQDAVAALRELCEEHGDNDWPDDLWLADVITKHLGGL